MIEALNSITSFDWLVLITAGCIAFVGLWCNYRFISGSLFASLCIVIGSQELLVHDVSSVSEAAPFYFMVMLIYLTVMCISYFMHSLFMTTTNAIIAASLLATMFMALYGVDNSYYEGILGTIWVIQLIGSLSGVLNGYRLLNGIRRVFSNIWNHIALRHHKGV